VDFEFRTVGVMVSKRRNQAEDYRGVIRVQHEKIKLLNAGDV